MSNGRGEILLDRGGADKIQISRFRRDEKGVVRGYIMKVMG
jgi:hypothetical protein